MMGHDIKPLALGYAVAKFVGLSSVLDCAAALAGVAIDGAKTRISQRKIGVKRDSMLVKGYGFLVAALVASLFALRERLQRSQRRGGGLFERFVELPDGGQRFTQLAAHARCGLAQRRQYRFLALRLFLVLGDGVAVNGVDGIQGDHVLRAELRDVADKHGLGGGALGEIAREFRGKPS